MRTYDLTPFYRSTVGFDRLFSLLDQTTADASPGYPSCTLLGVRRHSNGVAWRDGPNRREQPNPPVP
jgi:hypothetical protein